DGRVVAAANGAGALALWDPATGKRRCAVEGEKDAKLPRRRTPVLALSPDGRTLAVVGKDPEGGITLHDATTGKRLPISPRHEATPADPALAYEPPHALAFSPDGRTLLAASRTDGVRLYETATGKEARQLLEPSEDAIGGVAFAPDGRSLAARTDATIRVWEAATGGERRRWDAPAHPEVGNARAVALSPGGRFVAVSGGGAEVSVGRVAACGDLRGLTGHGGPVTALAFAAGGRLLSVSRDGTAILWDTASLKWDRKEGPEKVDAAAAWAGLDDPDPARAFQTMARLEDAPAAAVALLRGRLKPAAAADPRQIERLIARLDDDDFEKREAASKELANLGPQAEKALRQAVKDPPSAEAARRIKELLKRIEDGSVSAGRLREARALEVLEAVGTAEARKVLEELARGAADAALTQEAKASLSRLSTGPAAP
ncbi:MAG TPA: hypothetical protein VFW33_08240, partial [Gemmataceae bacterium]|nr:hypothetical protein [Gemmataceae bacterium]